MNQLSEQPTLFNYTQILFSPVQRALPLNPEEWTNYFNNYEHIKQETLAYHQRESERIIYGL